MLLSQETEQRFSAWQDNLRYVEEYNAKHKSHWVSGLQSAQMHRFCSF